MNSLFVDKKSPFHRFLRIIHLGYIGKEEFKKYILGTLKKEKIPVNVDFVDSVLNFTRGHPYYTQLALQQLLLDYSINGKIPTFYQLIDEMTVIEEAYLEKLWEGIFSRKEDMRTLLALIESYDGLYARLKDKGVNVSRSLKSLIGSGIIFETNGKKFIMTDPLLEYWIRTNVLK